MPVKHKNFIVGILNGREPANLINENKVYGKFRPGLFLFNPKTGEIPWVDSNYLFEDPDATTITFVSDFLQIEKDKGLLYCHVNDSFVRAYEIDIKDLKRYLDERINI